MKFQKFVPIIVFFFLFLPTLLLAQNNINTNTTPLVPCGLSGTLPEQCQFCHLIALIQRVINFIIVYLAAPVATLLIAFAGAKLIVQADNESARSEAKQLLKDILVGFLWILLAWTAVLMTLNLLVKDSPQDPESSWFRIQCYNYPAPNMDFTTFQGGAVTTVNSTTGTCAGGCSSLPSGIPTNGNACRGESGGATCQVSSTITANLSLMWSDPRAQSIGLRASETWPPVASHRDSCHTDGTCIDASLPEGSRTASNIRISQEIARNSGMYAQYEVPNASRRTELIQQGVPERDIIVVSNVSEHFSVYRQGYRN